MPIAVIADVEGGNILASHSHINVHQPSTDIFAWIDFMVSGFSLFPPIHPVNLTDEGSYLMLILGAWLCM